MRRRSERSYRYTFVLSGCDGEYITRGANMTPMREWLKANAKGQYKTQPEVWAYNGAPVVRMDDQTTAIYFKVRWASDIVKHVENKYWSIYR